MMNAAYGKKIECNAEQKKARRTPDLMLRKRRGSEARQSPAEIHYLVAEALATAASTGLNASLARLV